MNPTQFAFEYEVTIKDPDTGEHRMSYIWTPIWNKGALKTEHVVDIKLKQNKDDRGN